MSEQTILVTAIVVALTLIAVVVAAWDRRRRLELRQRFGPEYDRMVEKMGSRARAEAELARRGKRVDGFAIRPLNEADRARFASEWGQIQTRFVDRPQEAVASAHRLVVEVMNTRGYPLEEDAQLRADLSAGVPHAVEHYRQARAIAERNETGAASTEDLRQAVVHYRELFKALLAAEDQGSPRSEPTAEVHQRRRAQ
jgi:hypothetical protein